MPKTLATVLPLVGLFFSGVEQHDDKDEKHHDGAGVDDHLHDGDELSAEQHVDEASEPMTTMSESALLMVFR